MKTTADNAQNPKFRPNRTFICSVVFFDIVEYTKKSVDEQIRLKERFNALLSEAIADVSVNDRIVLDTGDGAAIGFLGDPEDALFVAMSLRDAIRDDPSEDALELQVRMGINLGPVKLLKDINNQMNLIGDGINVSQRIMSFAEPGQMLVSRSYYEVVSCLSQEYAKLFQHQGARADKHVREHDVYAVEHTRVDAMSIHGKRGRKPDTASKADTPSVAEMPLPGQADGVRPQAAVQSEKSHQNNKMLIIGGLVAAVIIALVLVVPRAKTPPEGIKTAQPGKSSVPSASVRTPQAEATPSAAEAALQRATAAAIEAVTPARPFRSVSAEARDIMFTVTEVRASGSDMTLTLQVRNKSDIVKSVALYDDSYRWTKSTLTDGSGKQHGVNSVSFVKDTKRTSMRDAGTEGMQISPGRSVTAYLTFKKAGRGAAALHLHPFIYQGRRDWKEYDLNLNLRS